MEIRKQRHPSWDPSVEWRQINERTSRMERQERIINNWLRGSRKLSGRVSREKGEGEGGSSNEGNYRGSSENSTVLVSLWHLWVPLKYVTGGCWSLDADASLPSTSHWLKSMPETGTSKASSPSSLQRNQSEMNPAPVDFFSSLACGFESVSRELSVWHSPTSGRIDRLERNSLALSHPFLTFPFLFCEFISYCTHTEGKPFPLCV